MPRPTDPDELKEWVRENRAPVLVPEEVDEEWIDTSEIDDRFDRRLEEAFGDDEPENPTPASWSRWGA